MTASNPAPTIYLPTPQTPLVNLDGTINQTWYRFLQSLITNVQGASDAASNPAPAPDPTVYAKISDLENLIPSPGYIQSLVEQATTPPPTPAPYDIIMYNGSGVVPAANQVLLRFTTDRALNFPANFEGSTGTLQIAPTAKVVLDIDQALAATPDTFKNIGSATIQGGSVNISYSTVNNLAPTFATGDVLRIIAPAVADATAAGVSRN